MIVDLAAEAGGNCELTEPGEDRRARGVTIVGLAQPAAQMPSHASQLYARNVSALLLHLAPEGELTLDLEDEITAGACVTRRGGSAGDDAATRSSSSSSRSSCSRSSSASR